MQKYIGRKWKNSSIPSKLQCYAYFCRSPGLAFTERARPSHCVCVLTWSQRACLLSPPGNSGDELPAAAESLYLFLCFLSDVWETRPANNSLHWNSRCARGFNLDHTLTHIVYIHIHIYTYTKCVCRCRAVYQSVSISRAQNRREQSTWSAYVLCYPQMDISRRSFSASCWPRTRLSFSLGDYHTAGHIFKWRAGIISPVQNSHIIAMWLCS
jgi:hypothetical protein